jgi:hypothetical protein
MERGGCMKTYGHWFSPGNPNGGRICIYTNDASSGQTFRENICQNVSSDVMKVNGGQANTIEGNMFL